MKQHIYKYHVKRSGGTRNFKTGEGGGGGPSQRVTEFFGSGKCLFKKHTVNILYRLQFKTMRVIQSHFQFFLKPIPKKKLHRGRG